MTSATGEKMKEPNSPHGFMEGDAEMHQSYKNGGPKLAAAFPITSSGRTVGEICEQVCECVEAENWTNGTHATALHTVRIARRVYAFKQKRRSAKIRAERAVDCS